MQIWLCKRREDDAEQEGKMLDFLQWTSVLLALLGLFLWFCSGGIRADALKRQIRRVAVFAAIVSALLQVAGSAEATQHRDVVLWASATPVDISRLS